MLHILIKFIHWQFHTWIHVYNAFWSSPSAANFPSLFPQISCLHSCFLSCSLDSLMLTRTVCVSSHRFGLVFRSFVGSRVGTQLKILVLCIIELTSSYWFSCEGKGLGAHPLSVTVSPQDRSPAGSMHIPTASLNSWLFSALQIAFLSPSPYSLTLIFFLLSFSLYPEP